jgi:hypothetical protein
LQSQFYKEGHEKDIPAIEPEKTEQARIQKPDGNSQRAQDPQSPQDKRPDETVRFR